VRLPSYDEIKISSFVLNMLCGKVVRIRSAVYCSPIADVIAQHGVQYQQYADDTQLHLAMRTDNTPAGLSVLAEHRCH